MGCLEENRTLRAVLPWIVCAVIVASMVSGVFISQVIQLRNGYHKPYFLMFFTTINLWLLTAIQLCYFYFAHYKAAGDGLDNNNNSNNGDDILTDESEGHAKERNCMAAFLASLHRSLRPHLTPMKLFLWSGAFTVPWIAANYSYVVALEMTNGPSTLSLEQLATVFVFIGSVVFLKERVTVLKVVAVLVVVGGAVVVAFADYVLKRGNEFGGSNPLLGDLLIVGSTLFTATYLVAFARFLHFLKFRDLMVFLGGIGVWTLSLGWWPLLVVNYTGFEVFEWPSPLVWGLIVVNTLVTLLYNFVLNWGVLIASPLFIRIAFVTTIPISFLVDLAISLDSFNWMRLLGALIIGVGFVLFSVVTVRETRQKERESRANAALGESGDDSSGGDSGNEEGDFDGGSWTASAAKVTDVSPLINSPSTKSGVI